MTKVYYWKNGHAVNLMMGYDWCKKTIPDIFNKILAHDLSDTHVLLKEIPQEDQEEVFMVMQGEMWSPHGEANRLIESLGLGHTSMSVGDIIEQNGKFFFCDCVGFKEI